MPYVIQLQLRLFVKQSRFAARKPSTGFSILQKIAKLCNTKLVSAHRRRAAHR
jgi:hypothetical protein